MHRKVNTAVSMPTQTIPEPGSAASGIWILGGGNFGLKSAELLRKRHPDSPIIVVDVDFEACRQAEASGFETFHRDGIDFLLEGLSNPPHPRWIVPVIPEHVAYLWVRAMSKSSYPLQASPVPKGVLELLPNPMAGDDGEIYMSLADFECPEDCPEPTGVCSHTGKSRIGRLFQILSDIQHENYRSVVLRSLQLLPGVGGFRPQALFDLLHEVQETRGPMLLSTACSCHGVMHAIV